MDNVYIGLTSSNGVTFAQDPTGSGSACQPTCWFDLPKSAPPTALDPRLHRRRSIVLTIERGDHYRAGLSVKSGSRLHRPGGRDRAVPTKHGLCQR